MKHAMIMTIHTNFNILQKFVDLYDDERYDFYILVDEKVKVPNEEIIKNMPLKSKVVFLERMNICWASYSQIAAYLELLNVSHKNNYDYYHFFQGSDFPLKTKDETDKFFTANRGKEFVNIYYNEFSTFKCGYYHFFVNNPLYRENKILKGMNFLCVKFQKIFKITRNKDIKFYHGSALNSISHECVQFVLENKNEIKRRFDFSLGADEVFLQTVLANSHFKDKIYRFENSIYANCRLIDWERRDRNSPYTFLMKDYEELINADEGICFCRKFNQQTSQDVVQKLYEHLKNKERRKVN